MIGKVSLNPLIFNRSIDMTECPLLSCIEQYKFASGGFSCFHVVMYVRLRLADSEDLQYLCSARPDFVTVGLEPYTHRLLTGLGWRSWVQISRDKRQRPAAATAASLATSRPCQRTEKFNKLIFTGFRVWMDSCFFYRCILYVYWSLLWHIFNTSGYINKFGTVFWRVHVKYTVLEKSSLLQEFLQCYSTLIYSHPRVFKINDSRFQV